MELLDIAIGKHRNTRTWQNVQMSWEDFAKKCSQTHRTTETHAEYLALPKARQDELKDYWPYVAGYLVNGRRKVTSIMHRSMVTLDGDFAKLHLWENFQMMLGCTGLMYTTRKHSPAAHRVRLVIPTDRPLLPYEYEPVARKVADMIGIEQFDHTTYDVNRLMYGPSTSRDGEFLYEFQEGEPLAVDQIQNLYRNWRDVSEWPRSERENKAIKTGITKQGDPLEKEGMVGVFCRTHTIAEAIEKYLPHVYESCDIEDRWTFKEGSTSGGLIIYDDKFAYSHHGTDPISGKLCNAFDLVRIHMFGSRDEHSQPDTPINRLPSYLAMLDLAGKDPEVRKTGAAEKFADAGIDFSEDLEDDEWLSKLEVDRRGTILSGYGNVEIIMQHDPKIKNRIRFNEFSGQIDILGPVPWNPDYGYRQMDDNDDRGLRTYLGKEPYAIKAPAVIGDIYPLIAKENSYHPIKEYLNELEWDGVKRVETLLVDYLGAEDTPLTRAFTRKTLCAAATRVFRPGSKFDYILTLISGEGARKSTFAKSLGLDWFSETFNFGMLSGGNGVRAYEQLRNKWIIEIPEMAGLRKAEIEAAKSFITSTEDSYRVSRGVYNSTFKRQCIFIGTSNNRLFLVGQTGNRRFWPVEVHKQAPSKPIQGEKIPCPEIDQIWAEVMQIYQNEQLYLTGELEKMALAVQESHTEKDEREGVVSRFLEMQLPANWKELELYQRRTYFDFGDVSNPGLMFRNHVCAAEIWCEAFGKNQGDMTAHNTRFIHEVIRNCQNWEPMDKASIFGGYGKQRGYRRKGFESIPGAEQRILSERNEGT